MTFDPEKVTIGPRPRQTSVLRQYIDLVANQGLLPYKKELQHGNKKGESLYTHILNGIMLLDALSKPLGLADDELRLLMTIYTVHDINKDDDYQGRSFAQIAIPENFADLVGKTGLDAFFPSFEQYFADMVAVARDHGAHSSSLAMLGAKPLASGLERERLLKLLSLIRAVDTIDLSHTLEERKHKADFLSHLNDFPDDEQYRFYLHRLTENRGTLSNLIHHALIEELKRQQAIPLLYYPDGVTYLLPKQHLLVVDRAVVTQMAARCTTAVNEMTSSDFRSFIKSGIQGIKVDPKCLELGISFTQILNEIEAKVQKRSLDRATLLEKIVQRTERALAKNGGGKETAVQQALATPKTLLPASSERLRDGELVRSYYIFLQTHFKHAVPDPWQHLYDLFALATDSRAFLNAFDARWDRPYVFMNHITHSYDTIYDIIETDGTQWVENEETTDDKRPLFAEYLSRYALFGEMGQLRPINNQGFGDHLQQYITTQHKQCVHCSTIFPTDKWMTNDVRSDVTVQTFSNRLRGGPGEPKKHICRLCQIQFLLERLNYADVRGEKTMYLHFFPYSFLTAPYLTALRDNIDTLRGAEETVRAVWCDTRRALLDESKGIDPDFATQTKAGKPHAYGLYLHRGRNSIGNRLIFPINPAPSDGNDSQRFLFALWLALVLQQHMGLKVLLSTSPVAPFEPTADLYLDNIALSCRGLVGQNEYAAFADLQKPRGERPLTDLRLQAKRLHQIGDAVGIASSKKDEKLALVQSMAGGSLALFYTAEKLLEARMRDQKGDSPERLEIRLAQRIFQDVESLAHINQTGGDFMKQLSDHLQKLAEIAWQGGLRGKTLKKNSLMMPLDHIFQKLNQRSLAFDNEVLKAVTIQDIFDYLERIADEYAPGKRKMASITAFVDTFYGEVYQGLYQGNRTRLLADEKMFRSAFLFYLRQQIYSKSDNEATNN